MPLDLSNLTVRIAWTRSGSRQWPSTEHLRFSQQLRRKQRHVLIYCWGGRGVRSTPTGTFEVFEQACFWSRPGGDYRVDQDPDRPLGLTAIHFDLLDPDGHPTEPANLDLPPECLVVHYPALVRSCTDWIAGLALDSRAGAGPYPSIETAAAWVLRGLLATLVHDTQVAGEQTDQTSPWESVTAHIQEHLHEGLTVQELARRFGYTRSHFCRLFRSRIGIPPQRYIINARLALAKELLRETSLPIGRVGLQVGYGDAFRFSKAFRQRTGVSPSSYRRSQTVNPT